MNLFNFKQKLFLKKEIKNNIFYSVDNKYDETYFFIDKKNKRINYNLNMFIDYIEKSNYFKNKKFILDNKDDFINDLKQIFNELEFFKSAIINTDNEWISLSYELFDFSLKNFLNNDVENFNIGFLLINSINFILTQKLKKDNFLKNFVKKYKLFFYFPSEDLEQFFFDKKSQTIQMLSLQNISFINIEYSDIDHIAEFKNLFPFLKTYRYIRPNYYFYMTNLLSLYFSDNEFRKINLDEIEFSDLFQKFLEENKNIINYKKEKNIIYIENTKLNLTNFDKNIFRDDFNLTNEISRKYFIYDILIKELNDKYHFYSLPIYNKQLIFPEIFLKNIF